MRSRRSNLGSNSKVRSKRSNNKLHSRRSNLGNNSKLRNKRSNNKRPSKRSKLSRRAVGRASTVVEQIAAKREEVAVAHFKASIVEAVLLRLPASAAARVAAAAEAAAAADPPEAVELEAAAVAGKKVSSVE